MSDFAVFTQEFLRSPMTIASPVPSSAALSGAALTPLPERGAPVVLELGAGSGATTQAVQDRLRGRGRHLAVENNPRLADLIRRAHPEVEVLCEDAHDAVRRLATEGVRIDLAFCALPWSVTAPPDTTIFAALAPLITATGAVSQIQHCWVRPLPVARQVRRNLEAHFEEVVVSRTVWRNAPPAVVYVARRARCRAGADERPAGTPAPATVEVVRASEGSTSWVMASTPPTSRA